ncbi:amino acid transporter [Parabacteroides sp. PF5-5]|uniref:hypothetical protein n=1 Tax=unclassified Parabacteroides TaxID=2649774 RepID=UPI00247422AE|nr:MULTISPECIES: hypothetical protein [unclassified Parabacteroides]MDH6304914.1 amino acid transporter [Parabacteroides sp. PH5-39]MDH6316000.1 amino acid transporter [Parabacteroides sp. PF5-13]MDH6319657.1 amino acid transporter [Parabacteroides sp. PH5-13]MDH6323388.1 amino acid transporter [Parabacteroides sp. PH5-8]MDH6327103.1 amino acid transporter [Parabacteroides sp. PH5-41]
MELEELKNNWSSLEEQLKKQSILNEKLIREIRQTKSGPLSRLINYGYFGIVTCILCIFFLIYAYNLQYFGLFKTTIFILGILLGFACIIIGIYNISHLKKIDFTKNVSENIRLVQLYKIRWKKQTTVICIFVTIIFIMAIIACLLSPNMENWRWIVIGSAIPLGVILGYLEYKKMYKKNTNAILQSLEELKELEEE